MTLGTSGAVAAGLAALVSGIAIYIAVLIWAVNRARTSYSAAIIRRLKGTDQPVVIQASDRRGIWNPAGSEGSTAG